VLAGNGSFIERLLGRMVPQASTLLDDLRPVVHRALSRRVHEVPAWLLTVRRARFAFA
jgi:hypothetical protein